MYKRSFGIHCSVSSEIRVKILTYCKILACDIKIVVLRSYGRIMQWPRFCDILAHLNDLLSVR